MLQKRTKSTFLRRGWSLPRRLRRRRAGASLRWGGPQTERRRL